MSDKFQIKTLPNLKLAGIKINISKSHSQNSKLISNLWREFNVELHKVENRPDSGIDWRKFGITFKNGEEYSYLVAVDYKEDMGLPNSMKQFEISTSKFAMFTHFGELKNISKTVNQSFRILQSNHDYNFTANNNYGVMLIEKYDKRFHWNRHDSEIELYLPIP